MHILPLNGSIGFQLIYANRSKMINFVAASDWCLILKYSNFILKISFQSPRIL